MLQITSFHSPVSKFPYLQARRRRERERGAAIYRKEARFLGPYLYRECPLISLRLEMKNECEEARASNGEDYDMTRDIVTTLNSMVDSCTPQQDLSECCIYEVPNLLRNVKPEAYTPQLISIGPLHHDNAKLQIMKTKKLICFREFKGNRMSDERIMDLVNIIRNKEKNIRQYYSKNFDEIGSRDFIEMILLDAVFIIEFLKESQHAVFIKNFEPWMMSDIKEDLKLLENQLPFFIIQEIYDEVISARKVFPGIPFLRLATFHLGKYGLSDEVRALGCSYDGHWRLTWSSTSGPVGLVEVRAS
uniref:Uncharacterized protein n=1 Tax=Populus alba TaxID=43335 RepID=A0A4U5MXD5_POPAL|nr:hypothetical protein D5086_0000293340 [Populus alba]